MTWLGWQRAILTIISFILYISAGVSFFTNSGNSWIYIIIGSLSAFIAGEIPKEKIEKKRS